MTINKIVLLRERKEETQHTTEIRGLPALSLKLELYCTFNCTDHSDLNKGYVPEVIGAKLVYLGKYFCHICSRHAEVNCRYTGPYSSMI